MSRARNRLSARGVATCKDIGWHADGGGLYLRITPTSRRWVFVFQWKKKRAEIGLGGAVDVSLARARVLADAARQKVRDGVHPSISANVTTLPAEVVTFGAVADALIDDLESSWKNAKHRQQWRNTLKTHGLSLRSIPVADVTTEDVMAVLKPIWTTKAETADRLRGRIERVLDAAKVRGLRDGENPARWKGHLAMILPARQKLQRGHHAAMPCAELPAFLVDLKARPALAARALELTIFTAVRSNEALSARWPEVDLDAEVWTIPAERMKAGKEHRVPLVGRALEMLRELARDKAHPDLVFPGQAEGKPLSNMSMEMLLRRMGKSQFTVHGMRSTMRDWAGDCTDFAEEIVEAALAHTVGSAVRRAYRRGDALDKRRELMKAWDVWCLTIPAESPEDGEWRELNPDPN